MNIMLDILIGLKLLMAEHIHDYIQLRFEDGTILNIFNRVAAVGFELNSLSDLNGRTIRSIDEKKNVVIIDLDGKKIQVGVADSDYCGPEVMLCISADGRRIVWQ